MRPTHCALLLAALAVLPAFAAAAPPPDPPGRVVTGTAIDPQGRPVAGAAVWLPPDDLSDEEYAAYVQAGPAAITGADGHFAVTLPAEREGNEIDVCAPGSLTGQIAPGAGAAGPVTVVVRPGARISGRVVDAAGAPVTGLIVATTLAGSSPSDLVLQASPCNHPGIVADSVTDREGRFTLAPLEPGRYTVRGGYVVESAPVLLASGQTLEGIRLVVEHGAQVTGRVTAGDGSPVANAKVTISASSATTDAEGRYRITGAAPGPASAQASDGRHGILYRQAELAEGENHLDLTWPDPR